MTIEQAEAHDELRKTIAKQDALIKQMGEALRAPKTLDGFTDTLKAIDAYNNWKRERGG